MSAATGYGARSRLLFDGDERAYELWEVKFLGFMRLQKLHNVILPESEGGVNDDELDTERNAEALAELVQCLDDRSLSLVLRDAKDNGREALKILREHYLSRRKPRIISLYTELTSLKKSNGESVTDYVIRAETAYTSLKSAGETISDNLLIAMVLKGLPPEFKPFSTVVTQKDRDQTFTEFKVALRSFEDTEKAYCEEAKDNVMKFSKKFGSRTRRRPIMCYACGKPNHKSTDPECPEYGKRTEKQNKWCTHCRNSSIIIKIFCESHDIKTVLVDCGATTHVIKDRSCFIKMDSTFDPEKHSIELADGSRIRNIAQGRGDACITLTDSRGNEERALLQNALFVPSFKQNIFSVQAATEHGAEINFKKSSAELVSSDGTRFNIKKKGRLYYLCSSITKKNASHTLKEWHEIMGHCNTKDIIKLESVVDGMTITNKESFECSICTEGKMTQYRNRNPDRRAIAPLELVHTDLAGPIEPVDKSGYRYVMAMVDDVSGLIMLYFLKWKSDSIEAMKKFLGDVSVYGTVKRLRCDNGGEFTSKDFKALLIQKKIRQEFSAPNSPHQNGTVERSWRSIFDMARCLLLESKLPKKLWVYAVMTTAYVRNRCYNPRIEMTPVEAFTGQKPNISNMNTFGSLCYAYVQNKTKLDARTKKGIFVGYDKRSPAYLVYFPDSDDVQRVRCVKFSSSLYEPTCDAEDVIVRRDIRLEQDERMNLQEPTRETAQLEPTEAENQREGQASRYPRRERKLPGHLNDYVIEPDDIDCTLDFCYAISLDDMPKTFNEAIISDEASHWKIAMDEEMCALEDNKKFDLVTIPEGKTVVGGRWVYVKKIGPDNVCKHKARYVAKGYSQIQDVDYSETFSPTAKITSIRMLMQLASQQDLIVHQMDVKTAYLNAPIDCELYVEQPEGYIVHGKKGEKLAWKLNKSRYGLKQSGRNWNSFLHSQLINENFLQSLADPCVYTRTTENAKIIIIVWVDDLIIASNNMSALCDVKCLLSQKFKMKDLGEIGWFLGIQFNRDGDKIQMNQTEYIKKVLQRFNMTEYKPGCTPCERSYMTNEQTSE